ncbi:MAG: butyryl-CoA:acetate CoA-transferase, partial [Selenomonadaceae bacterium]|nr:butyryl-CoA:acetate CoA-transferase [Selenomonadaceae bacterium]
MIDFISQYAASYRSKIRTAEQAAQVVKSGDWIDIGMGAGFASLMDAALAKRKDELWGVNVRGYLIHEPIQMVECDPERKHCIDNSWHMSAYERKLSDRGLCNYTSMVFRNLGHYYRNYLTVNVAMVAVTPMNAQGYFNFSISNAATREVLNRADIVIVEVNENLPWVFGGLDECIHVDDVDIVVEGEHGPLPHLDSAPATAEDRKIAELVVRRMVNGSTLQLGIGSLPNTVGSILAESDLKDFGVHTEMLCDSYLDLRRSGKITNRMKGIDRYKSVFGFALGAQELYDWVRENSGVVSYPVAYCNNATNLAKLENFVSINSCIAVDIYGQICAETAGMRHIS